MGSRDRATCHAWVQPTYQGLEDLQATALAVVSEVGYGRLDIPLQTWSGLADLFCSGDPVIGSRRGTFVMLLESAVAESMASVADGDHHGIDVWAPFWGQALRIGAVSNHGRILQSIRLWLSRDSKAMRRQHSKLIISLIGWAREADDLSLVLPLLRDAGGLGKLLSSVGAPPVQSPKAMDDVAVAGILTHKEAMDLRWVLEALWQTPEEESNEPKARRAKRRQRG